MIAARADPIAAADRLEPSGVTAAKDCWPLAKPRTDLASQPRGAGATYVARLTRQHNQPARLHRGFADSKRRRTA